MSAVFVLGEEIALAKSFVAADAIGSAADGAYADVAEPRFDAEKGRGTSEPFFVA